MAFTFTILGQTVFGNKRIISGTYASDNGSTGGTINSGLDQFEFVSFLMAGGAASAYPVVSAAPVNGSFTIATVANQSGVWKAEGL